MLRIQKLLLAALVVAASLPFAASAELRGDPFNIDLRKAIMDPDKDYSRYNSSSCKHLHKSSQ